MASHLSEANIRVNISSIRDKANQRQNKSETNKSEAPAKVFSEMLETFAVTGLLQCPPRAWQLSGGCPLVRDSFRVHNVRVPRIQTPSNYSEVHGSKQPRKHLAGQRNLSNTPLSSREPLGNRGWPHKGPTEKVEPSVFPATVREHPYLHSTAAHLTLSSTGPWRTRQENLELMVQSTFKLTDEAMFIVHLQRIRS